MLAILTILAVMHSAYPVKMAGYIGNAGWLC
jgi:hypothetical protein